MRKQSRAFITNVNGDRLLVRSIICNDEIVENDPNGVRFIKIEGQLDGDDPFMTTTREDIYRFLDGDLSVLKEEYDIIVTPTRTRLAAYKTVVKEYNGYTLDKTCTIRDGAFTIYLKQDRDGSMEKAVQNREANLDLMNAIVEMYENTL